MYSLAKLVSAFAAKIEYQCKGTLNDDFLSLMYFHCDRESQPRWQHPDLGSGGEANEFAPPCVIGVCPNAPMVPSAQ